MGQRKSSPSTGRLSHLSPEQVHLNLVRISPTPPSALAHLGGSSSLSGAHLYPILVLLHAQSPSFCTVALVPLGTPVRWFCSPVTDRFFRGSQSSSYPPWLLLLPPSVLAVLLICFLNLCRYWPLGPVCHVTGFFSYRGLLLSGPCLILQLPELYHITQGQGDEWHISLPLRPSSGAWVGWVWYPVSSPPPRQLHRRGPAFQV